MPRSIFYSKAAAFTYACRWLLYIKDAFLCLGISDVSMSKSEVYNNKISTIWGPVATTLALSMYKYLVEKFWQFTKKLSILSIFPFVKNLHYMDVIAVSQSTTHSCSGAHYWLLYTAVAHDYDNYP